MNPGSPSHPAPRTAAQWFAARRGGTDAAGEQAFQAWLQEDPHRADDYALCELTWDVAGEATAGMAAPRRTRRRVLAGAALLATAASMAGLAFWLRPASPQQFSTGAGEQRVVALEDGSQVMLNTRTQIEVRLGRHAREVELRAGEAFFQVAPDASRPFTVHTPLGSARAVGTHFNVYVQPTHLAVTTAEGRVYVDGGSAGAGVYVDAGRRADLEASAEAPVVSGADVNAALNWRARRLEVDDEPLAHVLQEFSRYTDLPVRPASAAVGALRVSAVLRTGDLAALRATLAEAFGLRIERQDGAYVVSERAARPR